VSDRLFDIEEIPEVPLFREPRRASAARGVALDSRFQNDYPADWHRCSTCEGRGLVWGERTQRADGAPDGEVVQVEFEAGASRFVMTALRELHDGEAPLFAVDVGTYAGFRRRDKVCPDCLGMGSLKARVRLEAGHRCVRCAHPYMPKGDAAMIVGAEPSWRAGGWSACDDRCAHSGPFRWRAVGWEENRWQPCDDKGEGIGWYPEHGEWYEDALVSVPVEAVEAAWRILTVHHLDGDKANCRWWNLAALCQRCHLEVQAKVVMERIYPHEHSEWFKPYAAGYYAFVYLCGMCGRPVDSSMRSWKNYAHPSDFDFPPHVCKPGLELTREQVDERMDELLALELAPT